MLFTLGTRGTAFTRGMSDTCSVSLSASADLNLLFPDKYLDEYVTVFPTWSCWLAAKKNMCLCRGFLTCIRKTFSKD